MANAVFCGLATARIAGTAFSIRLSRATQLEFLIVRSLGGEVVGVVVVMVVLVGVDCCCSVHAPAPIGEADCNLAPAATDFVRFCLAACSRRNIVCVMVVF